MLPSLLLHKSTKLSNAALLMVDASQMYRRSGITCCTGQLLLAPYTGHYNFTSVNYYSNRRKTTYGFDLSKLKEYFDTGLQQFNLAKPVQVIRDFVLPQIGKVGQTVSKNFLHYSRKLGLLKNLDTSEFDAWMKKLEYSRTKTIYPEDMSPGVARCRDLGLEFFRFLFKCIVFYVIYQHILLIISIWFIALMIAVLTM